MNAKVTRINMIEAGDPALLPIPDDMTGKTVIMGPDRLGERFQNPAFQFFVVTGGFGAKKGALGTKVFGYHLTDIGKPEAERSTYIHSGDVIGMASDALLESVDFKAATEKPINKALRTFMVIDCKRLQWVKADTIKDALKLSGAKRIDKRFLAFYTHPEAFVNDLGSLHAPEGTEITRIWSVEEAEAKKLAAVTQ